MKLCSVADCDRPLLARGWCNVHYRRWLRSGRLAAPKRGRKRKTHCLRGHPLSGKNVRIYYRPDGITRQCVRCVNYRQKLWRNQHRRDLGIPARGPRKPKRRQLRNIPLLVDDLLAIEGGWWTKPEICARLKAKENTVQKALSDLTRSGILIRRDWAGRVEWSHA